MSAPDVETKLEDQMDERYAYIHRNEFTSEIFKIELKNLGHFGIGELKKLLNIKLNLDAIKIKSPSRKSLAFICFRNVDAQEHAISVLDGYIWKNKKLKAVKSRAIADPLVKKRLAEQSENTCPKKKKTCIEATCPLYNISYEEQLKNKSSEMENILRDFGKELYKNNPKLKKWAQTENNGLPCKYLGIKGSPKMNEYRNKSEFAIGKNSEGEITVGFRLGSYADGSVEIGSIDDVPHLPEKMKMAAKVFEEYLKITQFKVFNPEHNSGHFRQLGVRTSETNGDVMILVGVYSQNLDEEGVAKLKAEVKAYFEGYDHNKFVCTSLYYQDLKRKESKQMFTPVEHLSGQTHIYDEINGLKFRISPLAFFQINTSAANVLYNEVIKLADPKPHSTVLDICCGAGTIGICFSKHCKKVLGVEIIPDAIKDAEFNVENNAISNCKFHNGNSDDFIDSLVKETVYSCIDKSQLDIVAVVDPPRGGLHNRSILAIRSAQGLDRLVYMSCNPKSALQNWIDLSRPISRSYRRLPFLPKAAVAVDMFPHTAHTELIVLFERVAAEESDDIEPNSDTKLNTVEINTEQEKELSTKVEICQNELTQLVEDSTTNQTIKENL